MAGSSRVVVVGGSVAGLSSALFLARRGHAVVVLEKDATPTPVDVDAAGGWRRRPTPQAAHSHAFLARTREVLATEAPEVLVAIAEAGCRDADLVATRPETIDDFVGAPGDEELVVLNARRSVLEWVLRRAVEREPGVDLRLGAGVDDLAVCTNGVRRAVGVVVDGELVAADVVIDAAGKRSPVRSWVGAVEPDRDVPCGISYLTRFYELHDGEPTALNRGYTHGSSFDRYSCLVFPADNGSFSVTFGILPEDRSMRVLTDPAAFQRAAEQIELVAPWVDPEVATPTTGVSSMSGLHNVLRRPSADTPLGLLAIGDAVCVTNPAHTRGTTLALVAAQHVAATIDEHRGDHEAHAAALGAFVDEQLAPWVEDSIGQDADRLARWRPDEEPVAPAHRHTLRNGDLAYAAQRDQEAWRAFTRVQNTLAAPADVLHDPEVVRIVAELRATGWAPTGSEAPGHDELVEVARSAIG